MAMQIAVEAQHLDDDGQDDEDCEVGRKKQHDAFHGGGSCSGLVDLWIETPTSTAAAVEGSGGHCHCASTPAEQLP
jgi:hypothetical protein